MSAIAWSLRTTLRALLRRVALSAITVAALTLASALVASPDIETWWGGLTVAVLIPILVVCGLVVGAAYGVSLTCRTELPNLEASLRRVVQPLAAQVLGAAPFPPSGLSVGEFEALVDATASRLIAGASGEPGRGRPRRLAGGGTRLAVRVARATVVHRFLARARARGERITRETAEAFFRDSLVDLALGDVRLRVTVAHAVITGLAGVLVLGPLVLRLLLRP